jgi:hypothetical protein
MFKTYAISTQRFFNESSVSDEHHMRALYDIQKMLWLPEITFLIGRH